MWRFIDFRCFYLCFALSLNICREISFFAAVKCETIFIFIQFTAFVRSMLKYKHKMNRCEMRSICLHRHFKWEFMLNIHAFAIRWYCWVFHSRILSNIDTFKHHISFSNESTCSAVCSVETTRVISIIQKSKEPTTTIQERIDAISKHILYLLRVIC